MKRWQRKTYAKFDDMQLSSILKNILAIKVYIREEGSFKFRNS